MKTSFKLNVPAKKFSTVATDNNTGFFVIYTKEFGKPPVATLPKGSLYDHEYLHYEGRPVNHHGFPRFAEASFDGAYPFGQANLSDKALPVKVRIKGFNGDAWGTCKVSDKEVALTVLNGTLELKRLMVGEKEIKLKAKPIPMGETVTRTM